MYQNKRYKFMDIKMHKVLDIGKNIMRNVIKK